MEHRFCVQLISLHFLNIYVPDKLYVGVDSKAVD